MSKTETPATMTHSGSTVQIPDSERVEDCPDCGHPVAIHWPTGAYWHTDLAECFLHGSEVPTIVREYLMKTHKEG